MSYCSAGHCLLASARKMSVNLAQVCVCVCGWLAGYIIPDADHDIMVAVWRKRNEYYTWLGWVYVYLNSVEWVTRAQPLDARPTNGHRT